MIILDNEHTLSRIILDNGHIYARLFWATGILRYDYFGQWTYLGTIIWTMSILSILRDDYFGQLVIILDNEHT